MTKRKGSSPLSSISPIESLDTFSSRSSLDLYRPPAIVRSPDENLASAFHERLVSWISGFDKRLDDAFETGVRLVSFGQTFTFRLQKLGYWNPSLMLFHGILDDGSPVELIQHVSQISILLMKLPRLNPTVPKTPIGFRVDASEGSKKN